MSYDKQAKLTRRQFAGAVAAGLAAPALVTGALAQEEKKPQAQPQQQGESFLEQGRQALREFPVPTETEPAFIFRAKIR